MIPMSITLSVDRSGSLLFDEDCGICVATAAWLAERVAPHRLRLVGLRDVDAGRRIMALVHRRPLAATLHFVRSDDTILTGARAVLAAGRLVPGWRFLAIMFDHRVGHALLEPLYRQIAAHRRRIGRVLGLPEACAFPPTNQGAV
jgi:predicted DCC family thiol-disulfide oxidoreductase YuxK